MKKGHIDIVTMGCSKNLIDSERLLRRLQSKGYSMAHNPENPSGEFVVVNTCGFIGDAKEESLDLILKLADLKKRKKIGKIVVMGCLSERYRTELPSEIPEVDLWYGKFDWTAFVDTLDNIELPGEVGAVEDVNLREWDRTLTTPPWSAYVKISEGCDRYCAYCAIPYITGRHQSRKIEDILEEVTELAKNGVKEFNIIAQDLSSYGLDIYGEAKLPELIDRMAKISGVEWIRLHYLYPADFPIGILEVMTRHDNVCKYIDLPLQHISDKVLKPMNRKISKEETVVLLGKIRERVPGIHIRTTIMTGFPGEDDEAFEELLDFIKEQKFERLGGFAYSEEKDTLAARTLVDSIPQEVKDSRLETIMNIQSEISSELNSSMIGKTIKVLVESNEDGCSTGRSEYDSPEVDQEVIISGCNSKPGSMIEVMITGAGPYELYGKQTNSNKT